MRLKVPGSCAHLLAGNSHRPVRPKASSSPAPTHTSAGSFCTSPPPSSSGGDRTPPFPHFPRCGFLHKHQVPSISAWKRSYQFPSPFCPSSPDTCRCGQVLMAAAEDAALPTQAVPSSRPSERNPWEQHSPGSRNARSTRLPSRQAQPQEGNAINTHARIIPSSSELSD